MKPSVSHKVKHTPSLQPNNFTRVIYPREMKTHAHRKTGTRMFIAILSMVAKTANNQTVHQQEKG